MKDELRLNIKLEGLKQAEREYAEFLKRLRKGEINPKDAPSFKVNPFSQRKGGPVKNPAKQFSKWFAEEIERGIIIPGPGGQRFFTPQYSEVKGRVSTIDRGWMSGADIGQRRDFARIMQNDPSYSAAGVEAYNIEQQERRKQLRDRVNGKNSNWIKSLNRRLGRGSDIGLLGQSLLGYGAMFGIVATMRGIEQTANKVSELNAQFRNGKIAYEDWYRGITQSIPILGQFQDMLEAIMGYTGKKKEADDRSREIDTNRAEARRMKREIELQKTLDDFDQRRLEAKYKLEDEELRIKEITDTQAQQYQKSLAAQQYAATLKRIEVEQQQKVLDIQKKNAEEEQKRLERLDGIRDKIDDINNKLLDQSDNIQLKIYDEKTAVIRAKGNELQADLRDVEMQRANTKQQALEYEREAQELMQEQLELAKELGIVIPQKQIKAGLDRVLQLRRELEILADQRAEADRIKTIEEDKKKRQQKFEEDLEKRGAFLTNVSRDFFKIRGAESGLGARLGLPQNDPMLSTLRDNGATLKRIEINTRMLAGGVVR